MLMLGEAMSIFARSTMLPSGCLPSRISRSSARILRGGRSRYGLFLPGFGQRAAVRAHLLGGLLST